MKQREMCCGEPHDNNIEDIGKHAKPHFCHSWDVHVNIIMLQYNNWGTLCIIIKFNNSTSLVVMAFQNFNLDFLQWTYFCGLTKPSQKNYILLCNFITRKTRLFFFGQQCRYSCYRYKRVNYAFLRDVLIPECENNYNQLDYETKNSLYDNWSWNYSSWGFSAWNALT